MKKHLIVLICLLCMFTLVGTASAETTKKKANFTTSQVFVDGEQIWITGFNIDGSNYYKLRDVASYMAGKKGEFDVVWNSGANAIEIKKDQSYIGQDSDDYYRYYYTTQDARLSQSKIIVDGELKSAKAYSIDNATYFQLRDLGKFAGFNVSYNSELNQIDITSGSPNNAYKVKAQSVLITNDTEQYFSRWKNTVNSYLYSNADGTLTTLEASDKINIATYDQNYQLLSTASIEYELPIFGAFYSGENYNYIAFGQQNKEENDQKEIIRIVKYDKQFKRISSASLKGGEGYTVIPFDAAAGRIAEHDNTLVFHTSRERYTTEDGLNHQSQLTLIVDTNSMQVINETGRFQSNHVSHSFDQYVLFDGSEHVLLDHGDAYPRSIVLNKGDGYDYVERDIVEIPGAIGANSTGVSIGGFEMSSSSYLVAYNTIDHSKAYQYTSFEIMGVDSHERDVMIASLPRTNVENGEITYTKLGSYIGTELRASLPQLVKISDSKYMVLWQEFKGDKQTGLLKYVYVDDEGNPTSDVQSIKYFKQSTVQPIVDRNHVIWYSNENNRRTFYTIPIQ